MSTVMWPLNRLNHIRGNWRKQSKTAPSLLTKSCHDIDFILWLLCSSSDPSNSKILHQPAQVTSSGSLLYFKKTRKPALAGEATNCYKCGAESDCLYSAKKIYVERQFDKGNTGWPVDVIDPEIEDLRTSDVKRFNKRARHQLTARLVEDYGHNTPQEAIDERPWFGRCVYEADNDVCDDQFVTITWEDDPYERSDAMPAMEERIKGRGAKSATFHMVAPTEKQCERRGRIYGTKGEIEYDSKRIRIFDFASGEAKVHHPPQAGGGHGGGDLGLAQQFVKAIEAVKTNINSVEEAQQMHLGCTLEDIIRSHAMVFAAEEARCEKKVVDWPTWWRGKLPRA